MNEGWKCPKCDWIGDKPISKTIKKVPFITCPVCATAVNRWVRRLQDRPGYCGNCANSRFTLKFKNHILLRTCNRCYEVINPDTKEVIVSGNLEGNRGL